MEVQVHEVASIDNSPAVIAKMTRMYREQLLSDVCLVVNGTRYPCHRVILSSSSTVFHVMLTGAGWRESSESEIELAEEQACAEHFGEFLEYLYTGMIHLACHTAMPFLVLADKYDVKDLVKVCIEYMTVHIPLAHINGLLVAWMQYALVCGHELLADSCKKFIMWNIEAVADMPDFVNFDADVFVDLLKQSNLVVEDEFKLYKLADRWLQSKREELYNFCQDQQLSREEVIGQEDSFLKPLIMNVMSHIRYPMMSPSQLAELVLSDVMKDCKDFLIEQLTIAMSFHKRDDNSIERVRMALNAPDGQLRFMPRMYTADPFSAQLVVEKLHSIPLFHTSTLLFSSQSGRSNSSSTSGEVQSDNLDWVVDVFPKGVYFRKCWLIEWQGNMEVPEHVLRTVRVSVTSHVGLCVRVKVGILIMGVRDNVEHVARVVSKCHSFDDNHPVVNFDDLMDYDAMTELVDEDSQPTNPYFCGPQFDSLKLNIVIVPLSQYDDANDIPIHY